MRTKTADEVRKLDELFRERELARREIKELYGDKTVTTRAIAEHLSISAQRVRADFRQSMTLRNYT